MTQAHDRTHADRWQAMQARAEARARRQAQAERATCARCDRPAMANGTRCTWHSATTARGQAWRRWQATARMRRTVARVALATVAAWAAWQVAGIVADGAVAGMATPTAHGRTGGAGTGSHVRHVARVTAQDRHTTQDRRPTAPGRHDMAQARRHDDAQDGPRDRSRTTEAKARTLARQAERAVKRTTRGRARARTHAAGQALAA